MITKETIQIPTCAHEAGMGLVYYRGKVYIKATKKELPIKFHKGNKYVNYLGFQVSISKIQIIPYDPVFVYIFCEGFKKGKNAILDKEIERRLKIKL